MSGESNFGCARFNLNHQFSPRNPGLPPKPAVWRPVKYCSFIFLLLRCEWSQLWLRRLAKPLTGWIFEKHFGAEHFTFPEESVFGDAFITAFVGDVSLHSIWSLTGQNKPQQFHQRCEMQRSRNQSWWSPRRRPAHFLFSAKIASSTAGRLVVRDRG